MSWFLSLSLPQPVIPVIHDRQLHNTALNDFIMLHGKCSLDIRACAVTHFDTLSWHLQPGPSLSVRQRLFLWGFQAIRVGIEQQSTQEKAGKGSPQIFSSRMQRPSALAQENTQSNSSYLATANNSTKEHEAYSPFWCYKQGKQNKYSAQRRHKEEHCRKFSRTETGLSI